MELREHPQGNYKFLTGIAPYSSAVIAAPGHTLARYIFAAPIPYRQGFAQIAKLLAAVERPKQALCAMELRIPAPLPFTGFIEFNQRYCAILQEWDIYVGSTNPVARTNVAPGVAAPVEPSIHAFTVTLPVEQSPLARLDARGPAFIIAGAGDLRDQADLTESAIVRPGDTSPSGMAAKTETVLQVMSDRLAGIEQTWDDVTTTSIYTVQPLHALMQSHILPRLGAAAHHSVNWCYSHPPIAGLEFEMDLRRPGVELNLP